MLKELLLQSKQEKKPFIHPYISFVIIYLGKYYCAEHYKPNGMNAGSMKSHLAAAHNRDFETGSYIRTSENFEEIIKQAQNQKEIKSKRELFLELYEIVPKLCALKDRTQAVIIANHVLEGQMRTDVVNYLIYLYLKDKEQAQHDQVMAN